MKMSLIDSIEKRIIDGGSIFPDEAVNLAAAGNLEDLLASADKIRRYFNGDYADLCTIMNAKSGKCSENCKYCAQSGYYRTGVPEYALVGLEKAVKLAKENEAAGVHRFSLVTSGGTLSEADFKEIVSIYATLRRETDLKLCASLGSLSVERAILLKQAGVSTYHHNIETGRSFFPNICTTHSFDSRIQTIRNARRAGLTVCSGGIVGMGETMDQRLEMAFELKTLGIRSVPVNILNPIKGTPLENIERLSPQEILRTVAVFRFIIPEGVIRYAGGRNALGEYGVKGLRCGINGIMVGNYLTTAGCDMKNDLDMIKKSGFII